MSKDSSRLSRLGVLAPAALSACMDASVLAVPAAGAIVSTVLKELSKAFMLKKWFHGIMSAKEAELLMMEKGKNGSFLVRESQAHPGEYVLTVRVRGRVSHVMIRRQQNKYDVGSGEQFDDLVGLIEHFRSFPMIETSGDVLRLLQPVSGSCLQVKDKQQKAQEMEQSQVTEGCSYEEEFEVLKMVDDITHTSCEGLKKHNTDKNRYNNVLPYDQTRVILRNANPTYSDYINANYIYGNWTKDSSSSVQSSNESLNSVSSLILRSEPQIEPLVSKSLPDDALRIAKKCINNKINHSDRIIKDKSYIATQGCLPNTINHFWHMLWQENIRVVAMITNEVEKGKIKCERYWPLPGLYANYNNITVNLVSEKCYGDYTIRELNVKRKEIRRTIYQYHYMNWPDHSTPPDPDGVLAMIEDINCRLYDITQKMLHPLKTVLCVHCSAGVGRTGTFIVLDMLLDKIEKSGCNCEIDVHKIVLLVRSQRQGMVQNKKQYRFIYLALQRYVENNNIKLTKKIHFNNI